MQFNFSNEIIEQEINTIMDKINAYYKRIMGPGYALYASETEPQLRRDICTLFEVAKGNLANISIVRISELYEEIKERIFRSAYETHIPQSFWKTPLGEVFTAIEQKYIGENVSAKEAAEYLGKSTKWLFAHWKELGGYPHGTNRYAFRRSILTRFKKEILEDTLTRGVPWHFWEADYWETPLGKEVGRLNQQPEKAGKKIGVKQVLEILGGKSRQFIYDHIEDLGGKTINGRVVFDEETARRRAKELGYIK